MSPLGECGFESRPGHPSLLEIPMPVYQVISQLYSCDHVYDIVKSYRGENPDAVAAKASRDLVVMMEQARRANDQIQGWKILSIKKSKPTPGSYT